MVRRIYDANVLAAVADTVLCREIVLNIISLAFGFLGNIFLLLNFTGRVRYIVALPLSIIFWVLSSLIVSPEPEKSPYRFGEIRIYRIAG